MKKQFDSVLPCIKPLKRHSVKKICAEKKRAGIFSLPSLDQPFVIGSKMTEVGEVPLVGTDLNFFDRFGAFKVRWNIGRAKYAVEPGLYAIGNPGEKSPVFVTANYKMSFDRLRASLNNMDSWILVLETDGVNVWCSAGKGTFSTEELVGRIISTGTDRIVNHRQLILPQLAAPGISAHQVKKLSEFTIVYGPVRAEDLIVFMKAGLKATREMRRKTFNMRERAVLIPVEIVAASKWAVLISIAFFILSGFRGSGQFWISAMEYGLFPVLALFSSVAAGAVLTPLLLPWLPGRAFSLKGFTMGIITAVILTVLGSIKFGTLPDYSEILPWLFLVPSISAYLAMNFTGASTYTSLSGVRREMKWAVPFQIAGGALGLVLFLKPVFMF